MQTHGLQRQTACRHIDCRHTNWRHRQRLETTDWRSKYNNLLYRNGKHFEPIQGGNWPVSFWRRKKPKRNPKGT